jgi:hypothetical protein
MAAMHGRPIIDSFLEWRHGTRYLANACEPDTRALLLRAGP